MRQFFVAFSEYINFTAVSDAMHCDKKPKKKRIEAEVKVVQLTVVGDG